MASAAITSPPNSLQLHLALNFRNSRKYPAVLALARVRKLDRRFRLFCIAQDGSKDESPVEPRQSGTSWVKSEPLEGFSGWSGSAESGEEVIDPQKKTWAGGLVGTGVVGLILFSGLTFAALSISRQNSSSRQKQQMEPLTTQQEIVLTSDEQIDKLSSNEKEKNFTKEDSSNLEDRTGTYKDTPSYPEYAETSNENRPGDDVKYPPGGSDIINNDSIKEDLPFHSTLDENSDDPESSLNFPESEIIGESFVSSGSKDFNRTVNLTSAEDNQFGVPPINLTVSDANSPSLGTENQDDIPGPSDNQSDPSVSSSTVCAVKEPVGLGYSVGLESGLVLEHQEFSKDDLDSIASPILEDNEDLSKSELASGGVSESIPLVDEEKTDDYNVVDRTGSESPIPANSFSAAGIPAPVVSAGIQALPGKVLIAAVVDQVQAQALAALQVLKVIEADVEPGDLCTHREYARWLVSASSALSRNTISKVYPSMYIENVTELAFDDITPDDPDFASIQGLAEAGLISSKLSRRDMLSSLDENEGPLYFSPESPLSRQELVSWKMSLEKQRLPEADREILRKVSGFIDVNKIHPDACPALVADLSTGEQGIIALAFGYTKLFLPNKPVTKAQAAIALSTGEASDIVSEELARIEAESMAENAVAEHNALVAEAEKDINASFEKELLIEREKADAVEKMADEARQELERLRSERESEKLALMKERAAVESEMEVLSRLRSEVEEHLQSLMSNKVEISYEKERISKLQKEAEIETQEISRLQYELEVERKALSMARSWAEDEAKRAREQAKALEEARDRWERQGIKVVVDKDLNEQASGGDTWLDACKKFSVEGTVSRAENMIHKLKSMAANISEKSRNIIYTIIEKISLQILNLKELVSGIEKQAYEAKDVAVSRAIQLGIELQQITLEFRSGLTEGGKRVAGDFREGVEKLTQKFKTS